MKGARVICIAGGPRKCAWLTDELGLDGAIDYKNENVHASLDRLCPNGVDVDFQNVGGTIMDTVFARLNNHGRLVLCGMISTYNNDEALPAPSDFGRTLMHRLTIRGFIMSDYFPRASEARGALRDWVADGRIQWKVHVIEGLENAVDGLRRLFTGEHDGKLLVQVSPA